MEAYNERKYGGVQHAPGSKKDLAARRIDSFGNAGREGRQAGWLARLGWLAGCHGALAACLVCGWLQREQHGPGGQRPR